MKIISRTLLIAFFFVLGILAAVSLLTLTNWGRTRFDYLLIYAATAEAAGASIKKIFLAGCLTIAPITAFAGIYFNKKIRLLILLTVLGLFSYTFQLYDYIRGIDSTGELYEREYKMSNLRHPAQKRNLIVLYLESIEKGYDDYDGKGTNLIPNLTGLAAENISFDNFRQLAYANATISAQAAGLCAVGYKAEPDIRNLKAILNNTLNNAVCYSDILADAGYNTYFMKGALLEFSGTGDLVKQHGFSKAEGFNELKERLNIRSNDREWGINDRLMYQEAKKQILELAKESKPFLAVLTTLDTHSPMTFDKYCPAEYNDARDVIKCADLLAADFVHWLQEQNFYQNTAIIIIGDHIALEDNVPGYSPKDRQIFNVLINPIAGLTPQQHQWTTLDIAPTVLEAIGYSSPKFGLGRSLWQKEPTLYEKYGDDLDFEFSKNSKFYKKLNAPGSQTVEFIPLKINRIVKGDKIGNYAAGQIDKERIALNISQFKAVWTDSLQFKIPQNAEKKLCFKSKFLMIRENSAQNSSADIVVNGKMSDAGQSKRTKKRRLKRKFVSVPKLSETTAGLKLNLSVIPEAVILFIMFSALGKYQSTLQIFETVPPLTMALPIQKAPYRNTEPFVKNVRLNSTRKKLKRMAILYCFCLILKKMHAIINC